jgi:hypothetical protein
MAKEKARLAGLQVEALYMDKQHKLEQQSKSLNLKLEQQSKSLDLKLQLAKTEAMIKAYESIERQDNDDDISQVAGKSNLNEVDKCKNVANYVIAHQHQQKVPEFGKEEVALESSLIGEKETENNHQKNIGPVIGNKKSVQLPLIDEANHNQCHIKPKSRKSERYDDILEMLPEDESLKVDDVGKDLIPSIKDHHPSYDLVQVIN